MCLLCIEIAKGNMTIKEARGALTELVVPEAEESEHYKELQKASDEELLKKAKEYKVPFR